MDTNTTTNQAKKSSKTNDKANKHVIGLATENKCNNMCVCVCVCVCLRASVDVRSLYFILILSLKSAIFEHAIIMPRLFERVPCQ